MILDALHNSAFYEGLHPFFPLALSRLRELASQRELAPGRLEVEGEDVFAVVIQGVGKPQASARTETHRRYIDIQYTAEGTDIIGWMPASECLSPLGYDEKKDIEFYGDRPACWCEVKQNHFAIFFPSDAHAPMANTDQSVTKIVLKIAV